MIDVAKLLKELGIDARRKGDEWWAPCPLPGHSEKIASWSISNEFGGHHCFGCGRQGGATMLVADVIGITYSSAHTWMRERGVVLEDLPVMDVAFVAAPVVGRAFVLPREVVQLPLDRWVTPARRYVASRGITAEQVARWRLGYVVDGWLAGRIVFPFADECGVVGSWSARTFTGGIKYLTPPEASAFDPAALFGPAYWTGRRDVLVVTEGAIDALACERAGAPAIAALSGSALSPGQIARLATFGAIIVATDPDDAGERAAEALMALGRWCDVRRAKIPKGKDAASMQQSELRAALELPRHIAGQNVPARSRDCEERAGGGARPQRGQPRRLRSRAGHSSTVVVSVDLQRGSLGGREYCKASTFDDGGRS